MYGEYIYIYIYIRGEYLFANLLNAMLYTHTACLTKRREAPCGQGAAAHTWSYRVAKELPLTKRRASHSNSHAGTIDRAI